MSRRTAGPCNKLQRAIRDATDIGVPLARVPRQRRRPALLSVRTLPPQRLPTTMALLDLSASHPAWCGERHHEGLVCPDGVRRRFCGTCLFQLQLAEQTRGDAELAQLATATPGPSARTRRFVGEFGCSPVTVRSLEIRRGHRRR